MKCLWLTLADPDPPDNGQYLYSGGLIRAVAAAGSEVHVIGLARPGSLPRLAEGSDHVTWYLAPHRTRSDWAGLVSPSPQIAVRTRTREMRVLISELLEGEEWDAVVFDSISVAWALSPVLRYCRSRGGRPRIVYLSHNDEENVARHIAAGERQLLKRIIKTYDAAKVTRLERTLMRHADVITSNSPHDAEQFQKRCHGKPILFLPPGYRGKRVATREIAGDVPRRAIIVGSFDWAPKRVSLENFLRVADPLFARAGVALHIVGSADDAYLRRMRQTFGATTFTGRVSDIHPHMEQARVALVPDDLGGFKLKALDYVFNRLPILAIAGAVPGMPLRRDEGILLFDDHRMLALGVLQVIDDFGRLNRMHDIAYSACGEEFDWNRIGGRLVSAMSLVNPHAVRDRAATPLVTTV